MVRTSLLTLNKLLDEVVPLVQNGPAIFLLYGKLGAGKTYLVKQLLERLKAIEYARSPSFVLLNLYNVPNLGMIGHLDLYRLLDANIEIVQVVEEIGLPDYLGNIPLFIEWPHPIEEYLNQYRKVLPMYKINIILNNMNDRWYEFGEW